MKQSHVSYNLPKENVLQKQPIVQWTLIGLRRLRKTYPFHFRWFGNELAKYRTPCTAVT